MYAPELFWVGAVRTAPGRENLAWLCRHEVRPGGRRPCPDRLRLKTAAHVQACSQHPARPAPRKGEGAWIRAGKRKGGWLRCLHAGRPRPHGVDHVEGRLRAIREAQHDAEPAAESAGSSAPCLESLYRDESPRLVRWLTRRTGCRETARDLVQDIFCRLAVAGLSETLRIERPRSYLGRIAANLLRDRARAAARKMTGSHMSADDASLAGPDQQQLLEARDMLMRIERAMLKLRPRTREIFMAHRVNGLSYAEIAERTGLTVKGVEKQMSRAIAQIDRLVGRD
jgi:RNA polymerase sigma factor (sigma-70 family)